MPPKRTKNAIRSNREPFKKIAICLSGGGYRAAAFHLGTLKYLEKIKLLKHVTLLSTVSGGTLTGSAYAFSLIKKKTFDEFYNGFHSFLTRVNLIKESFALVGKETNNALGFEDMITSIADVYDRELFSGERFGIFWSHTPIHLKEIIFNATEFKTGVAFRFQKSTSKAARIGNGNVSISAQEAQKIRLADIAAASSCFPGGFEPLAFPHDFRWPDNDIPLPLKEQFEQPLPLMDGGIYDNQGIDSALTTLKRKDQDIDVFIISDTDQPRDEIYNYPGKKKKGFLTLGWINILSILLIALSVLSCGALLRSIYYTISDTGDWMGGILFTGFPALVVACLAGVLIWIRIKIKQALKRVPKYGIESWKDLKRLTTDQFADLLELRITSLFALAASVFMKRIRGLVFEHVYGDEKFEEKRISNLIYKLFLQKTYDFPWLNPSTRIQNISQKATATPTTLWFDNDEQLSDLVECGQVSICHTLLEFIIRRYGDKERRYPASIRPLFAELKKDWGEFNQGI